MRAEILAGMVKRGLDRRMTEQHLTLMEVDAERAIRDEIKTTTSAVELLALVGEVRAQRAEIKRLRCRFSGLIGPEEHDAQECCS
ncbi:hypothetical protein LCGC14_1680700 [marine sediment metagenome]|uniref:Uncharacterized protein n=1 Tax=marine sediment metagenome TaxID=412755 RepID=A0A0F9KNS4_9ZZZZ